LEEKEIWQTEVRDLNEEINSTHTLNHMTRDEKE
jgi:hypothetical protein